MHRAHGYAADLIKYEMSANVVESLVLTITVPN